MRLTWSNDKFVTYRGKRGANLKCDGEPVGHVRWNRNIGLWSWWAYFDNLRIWHTEQDPKVSTLDAAKAACEAYVRSELGLPAKKARAKP